MSSDRLGIGVFVVCQYQDIRSPAPRVYLLVCFSFYSFLCIFLKQGISQSIGRKALGFKNRVGLWKWSKTAQYMRGKGLAVVRVFFSAHTSGRV